MEYGDFACPDCGRLQDVLRQVYDESGKPLKYVFLHLPLVSSGGTRHERAIAAEASARQGKYWEMHAALFRYSDDKNAVALSNAGIAMSFDSFRPTDPLTLGIVLGLVLGKPIGIFLGSFVVDRLGIGTKPDDATWSQLFGVGCLCGIGFTMSIFIANEAFSVPEQLETAKSRIADGSSFLHPENPTAVQ